MLDIRFDGMKVLLGGRHITDIGVVRTGNSYCYYTDFSEGQTYNTNLSDAKKNVAREIELWYYSCIRKD